MQKDYFSDKNKRFFKVAHLRHSKQVNAIKSGAKDKKFQNETYLQNLREITIAKYKIDIKKIEQADKCAPPDELYQKQDSKDILEVWALRKHISKSYIQRKRQAEANYSKSINQLCNQSFNLFLTQKHQTKLAEHILQQCDQKDQDFLQPKYTEPMAPRTDSKRSYWNVNQYKYSLPEPKTNKDHYFLTSVRNDSQASRTICYSNLGSNAKKVIRCKTEPDQKKKISEDSLTYLTAYSRNKYNLAVNSLVLKMKNNISTQRRMRNKTLER